jgi:hypothetical protein
MKIYAIKHKTLEGFVYKQYLSPQSDEFYLDLTDEEFPCFSNFGKATEFIKSGVSSRYAHISGITIEDLHIVPFEQVDSIIQSEKDAEILFNALMNPPQPTEALKKAAQDYKKAEAYENYTEGL